MTIPAVSNVDKPQSNARTMRIGLLLMPNATSVTKNQPALSTENSSSEPDEDAVREYAYHLYEQGGRVSGHDVEHWMEAIACLKANPPGRSPYRRLEPRSSGSENEKIHGDLM